MFAETPRRHEVRAFAMKFEERPEHGASEPHVRESSSLELTLSTMRHKTMCLLSLRR